MPIIRSQLVLRAGSALPKDNVVMTFHHRALDPTGAVIEAIAEDIRDFVVTDSDLAGPNSALMNFLANNFASTGHEVRCYTLDEDTGDRLAYQGAPPEHTEVFDFVGRVVPATSLPTEVACCLSYHNVSAASVPRERRRGRIYFGPLGTNAMAADASQVARPAAAFTLSLRTAAETLKDANVATPWVVYSRPFAGRGEVVRPGRPTLPALPPRLGQSYEIDQVWTDDAFDTVRKRGRAATGKTFGPMD